MTIHKVKIKRAVSAIFLLLLTLAGCATQSSVTVSEGQRVKEQESVNEGRIVQVGESADIDYICRLSNGEVAAATDGVAKDQPKSKLYLAGKETGPVSVTAVSPDGPEPEERQAQKFEQLIQDKLARRVAGMKEGGKSQVELTAHDLPGRSKGNYTSRLARVRTRSKEMNVPLGEFHYQDGKSPEVGQSYAYDPAFPGRIEAVTEKAAVVRFSSKVKPGEVLETPFGPGLIREDETHYYVDIDARKNALVRTGGLIGRIVDVDDKFITVDFGNTFAGETLFCDVEVEKIADTKPTKSETGK